MEKNKKVVLTPDEMKFSKEFERKILLLGKEIERYKQYGKTGDIVPLLYKCASHCWCRDPYTTVLKKK